MSRDLNLILHCGANHVTRDQVANNETPAPTDSHYPIPHELLIERVQEQLYDAGYNVTQEAYGLTAHGARFFGLMQLVRENDAAIAADHSIVLGVRNSHDKSFAACIVAGSGVFVCDNLSFSGEIKVARKHTVNILRDLNGLVHQSISRLAAAYRQQEVAFEAYKNYAISNEEAAHMLVEGMSKKVFGCTQVPKIWKEWKEPTHEEFTQNNVWKLFNAVTEVAKGWSPETKLQRTQLLHGLCDAKCGLLATAS